MLTLKREEKDDGDRESLRSRLLDGVLERSKEVDDGDFEPRFRAFFFFKCFFWLF